MSEITRREFIRVSTLAAAGVTVAACAKTAAPTAAPKAATATPKPAEATATPVLAEPISQEAPALAEMVKAGSLPPLDERLPQNPVVVEPIEQIGTYGGQWSSGTIETNGNDMRRNSGYEQLVRWKPNWDGVVPNACESYSSNEQGTEFTFVLRQGLNWSDGEPFTADDVVFWYEDVVMNREITPAEPRVPFVVERVDDFTISWQFETPNGLFIKQIAQINNVLATQRPKHYLQQFHAAYSDKAEAVAKEAGQATWSDMFGLMATEHQNAELPRIWPWVQTTALGESTTRIPCERNPYYFKVDPEGNQLPYIDRYNHELVANNEVLVLKCLNGEIDFQEQWINDAKNKPVFFDGQEQGGYHFWETLPTYVNEMVIMLNRDCTDPVLAEIFGNKDFRIGLSHAIDRQKLIDVVMVGQSIPHQAAPRPDSVYYHERLATQYTEFDQAKANEYLDQAGYAERDEAGFRMRPDGKRLSIILEIDQGRVAYVDLLELIKPMWAEVGIDMNVKLMERSLWEERCRQRNLEFHGSAHKFGGGGGESPILDPRYWFPNGIGGALFAKRWGAWYVNHDDEIALEPPPDVKAAMDLYDQIRATPDEDKQVEMLEQLLDMSADQFYCIGTVLEASGFGIVTNRLKNTPEKLPVSWIYPTPVPSNTCQFYIEEA